jgi:hypothetical protein
LVAGLGKVLNREKLKYSHNSEMRIIKLIWHFLFNITEHLNKVNIILQGKELLLHEQCKAVQVFKAKLLSFSKHAKKNKFTHISTLIRIYASSSAADK